MGVYILDLQRYLLKIRKQELRMSLLWQMKTADKQNSGKSHCGSLGMWQGMGRKRKGRK